jgi:hypothetical protein
MRIKYGVWLWILGTALGLLTACGEAQARTTKPATAARPEADAATVEACAQVRQADRLGLLAERRTAIENAANRSGVSGRVRDAIFSSLYVDNVVVQQQVDIVRAACVREDAWR